MNDAATFPIETSPEPREVNPVRRSIANAALFLKLGAAMSEGVERCFLNDTVATHYMTGAFAESSTEFREVSPDVRATLAAIVSTARREIIEDGMRNAITERLPGVVAKHLDVAIPALVSLIESDRIPPIVVAEILKELGRLRDVVPRPNLRWILERALRLPSAFIRDGAGLGLAQLADPATLPYLRQAVENEPNPDIRSGLQLVVDEIAETMANDGTAAATDQQA